jgi:hypothetical protein
MDIAIDTVSHLLLLLFAFLVHRYQPETALAVLLLLLQPAMVNAASASRYAILISCAGAISLFLFTLPGTPFSSLWEKLRLQERALSPYFYNAPVLAGAQPDWLSKLDDAISLADLTLPGTHDSAARFGGSSYECQSLTIRDQLELGIRWLDVRLRYDGIGALQAQHGRVDQRATFPEILAQINAFLEARPSEFVILKVQQEKSREGNNFGEAVERDLKASTADVFVGTVASATQLPTLGALRGKIVLMPRFFTVSFGTIQYEALVAQDDFKASIKDKRHAIAASFDAVAPITNVSIAFPPSDETLMPMVRRWLSSVRRKDEALRKLAQQSLAYKLGLSINYFSLHNNRESPALAASMLNGMIETLSQVAQKGGKRGMILAFDFPSIDTVQAVVSINFN